MLLKKKKCVFITDQPELGEQLNFAACNCRIRPFLRNYSEKRSLVANSRFQQ